MFKSAASRWSARAGQQATHLLLNGGKLEVPAEQEPELFALVARCVLKKERVCLTERRTPVFKLHADLDLCFDSSTPDDIATDAALAAAKSLVCSSVQFFEIESSSALLCWSAASPKLHKTVHKKMGIHVIFEDIYVDTPVALGFRKYCIDEGWQVDGLAVSIEDAFDSAVYTANGLRACWSQKGPDTPMDDVYEPRLIIRATADELDASAVDATHTFATMRSWLQRCSIRAHGTDCTGVRDAVLRSLGADIENWTAEDSTSCVLGRRANVAGVPSDVLEKLDAALPVHYAGQRFSAMMESTDGNVIFLRSTSRYCMNIGRQHHNNNVFFCLSRGGLIQVCSGAVHCSPVLDSRSSLLCRSVSAGVKLLAGASTGSADSTAQTSCPWTPP